MIVFHFSDEQFSATVLRDLLQFKPSSDKNPQLNAFKTLLGLSKAEALIQQTAKTMDE